MIRVKNRKCIRRLAGKSLRASKTRNIIAILAIALTTILFTAVFTIALSINDSVQEQNFRRVGTYSHGEFKHLSKEQFEEFKDDSRIKEYGVRRVLGMPTDEALLKNHVEISYCDSKCAKWSYLEPLKGKLPKEGTNEAATDSEVLKLLGVKPEIGAEFELTFPVDGVKTTEKFTLCGWWEKDKVSVANHVLIPNSRVNEILEKCKTPVPAKDGMTGLYSLDVMFQNASAIEENLNAILAEHGCQSEKRTEKETYIDIGVNWGYTQSRMDGSVDMSVVLLAIVLLAIIGLTGYLIIYNIFRISVVGDIRFYGLLKTIGTTGKQTKRMIRMQALFLSCVGIPIGLIGGWLLGGRLTPVVLRELNGVSADVVSVNPLIFAASALFSLITVAISCRKPEKIAAGISPVEAVRYTENDSSKKKSKTGKKGASIFHMAVSNMGRNKSRTFVTILSLTLAVVLFHTTIIMTNGFDMEKYLSSFTSSDFIFSRAEYFQSGSIFSEEKALPQEAIEEINAQGNIEEAGKIYGKTEEAAEFITDEYYRQIYGVWKDEETLDKELKEAVRNKEGKAETGVQLYGMEEFCLGQLNVLDGDLSRLSEEDGRYVAAVYATDDYGNVEEKSHWAKVGDTVMIRYIDEYEYYNKETGEIYKTEEETGDALCGIRELKYRDVEYEVAALVEVPYSLSYRYFSKDEFVMNAQTFLQDTKTDNVMLYSFNTEENATASMETFLSDCTESTPYDYESKMTYLKEFENFREMFLVLGGTLSFIIGLIGTLNFVNAVLTGMIARKREFAMLQSIGMTGKQLKSMLVEEGLFYAFSSVGAAALLSAIVNVFVKQGGENIFWFFSYHPTIVPILVFIPIFALLGICVPLILYRFLSKQTIVERLRETEN